MIGPAVIPVSPIVTIAVIPLLRTRVAAVMRVGPLIIGLISTGKTPLIISRAVIVAITIPTMPITTRSLVRTVKPRGWIVTIVAVLT